MKKNKSAKVTPITYIYPPEIIRRFKNSSTEWKLNWLEEVNNITNQVLTKKEKEIRNKIRQGMISFTEQANKFAYEICKSGLSASRKHSGQAGKTKGLKIGEKPKPRYGK